MWFLHHEVCLVVFLPHRTGWFRHFLVANTYLPGRAEHTGRPAIANAGLPYPRFYNSVMRPEPSPDSPADEHPGFSPASRPDENLREQLSRLMPKLPGDVRCPRKSPMCTASPHVKGSIRRGRTGCTRA